MQLHYNTYSIDVVLVEDEMVNYDKVITEDSFSNPTTKIEIKVSNKDAVLSRVLIIGFSGATTTHDNNVFVDDSSLLICVSDYVYSFKLPELKLEWKTKCDEATCFTITKFKEDYLILGELQIARLSKLGFIKWTFSARDIFVLPNAESQLLIENDIITIKDWQGYKYYLDENGVLIKEEHE